MTYIVDLKNQFFFSFTKLQRYIHLLKILHLYFRTTIMRRVTNIMTRTKLEKLARMIEKTKQILKYLKKKIERDGQKNKNASYNCFERTSLKE